MDAMAREKGIMIGPDDRASLLSSITAGPNVVIDKHGSKSSGRDHEIRIGMVGNASVGKTTLLQRFVKGEIRNDGYMPTIGYSDQLELKVRIDEEDFKIKFGDTAGQERYASLTKSYFQMHDAIVVVFDMTNPDTLEGAMRWINQIKEVKKMPLILVGNKSELEEYRILSDDLFSSIQDSTEIPCIQTSAYTGSLVEDAFTLIIQLAYTQ